MDKEIILPLILACIAALPGLYGLYRQSKKDKVDNADTISDAALQLLEPYKREVAELRTKIEALECDLLKEREKRRELEALNLQKDTKITEMQAEIDDLRSQVEALQKGRRH